MSKKLDKLNKQIEQKFDQIQNFDMNKTNSEELREILNKHLHEIKAGHDSKLEQAIITYFKTLVPSKRNTKDFQGNPSSITAQLMDYQMATAKANGFNEAVDLILKNIEGAK